MRQVFFSALLLAFGCHDGPRGVSSAVPGYLDFDNLPDTNFSCEGKVIGGYYADVETGCQMFHVCTIGQKGEITDIKFLCLNGTVFDQETRVCERVDEVDCSKTEGFYGLNLELYGNTGASYGLEEPEEADVDPEEAQSHHNPSHSSSSSPTPTSPTPATTSSTTPTPTTPTTTEPPPPPPPTPPVRLLTPPTTVSTVSSTLHTFNQKTHAVHYSTTSSPHSVSSSFLTFPSNGDQLFESGTSEGSGGGSHGSLDHFPPPPPSSSSSSPSSSSSWPQVNLQNGGDSGIIHQNNAFHAHKTTPKPPTNLFGAGGNSNGHTHHQFLYSTTKAPTHFFSVKSPGGFSVTSHPPVTQVPLKNTGHLLRTNIPDYYHDQPTRTRPQQQQQQQQQKTQQSFGGHHPNVRLFPNPVHFQYTGRPSHQHQVFTTPSVQSTVISSTSSVSSVKTTIKHNDNHQNPPSPPANVNTFAFGINSGLSPSTYSDDKHNETKEIPTPPSSYDDYHERDVALDPFFKDVPRISLKQTRGNRRRRRQTEEILRQTRRGNRRFRNQQTTPEPLEPVDSPSPSTRTYQRNSNRQSTRRSDLSPEIPQVTIHSPRELDTEVHPTTLYRRVSVRRKPVSTGSINSNRDSAELESQDRRTNLRNNPRTPNRVTPTTEIPTVMDNATEVTTTTRQPLPETSFSCSDKVVGGYYADPETDCVLFHICVLGRHGKIRDDKFLCGPGTRFDQQSRTCQAKHLVNCGLATSLYHVNLPFYFREDQEPVPENLFESHKISKRAVPKGARPMHYTDDETPFGGHLETDFSCSDKKEEGLYGDVETGCKFFHLCQKSKNYLHLVSTFMCPSGTLFNQPEGNCDTSTEVDCELHSLPEHSFSKSRTRNRREVVKTNTEHLLQYLIHRYQRDLNEESTEVYYEYYDESDENEENTGMKNLSHKEDTSIKGEESPQVLTENVMNQNQNHEADIRREEEHFQEEENEKQGLLDENDESFRYTQVKSTTPVSQYVQTSEKRIDKFGHSQDLDLKTKSHNDKIEEANVEDMEDENDSGMIEVAGTGDKREQTNEHHSERNTSKSRDVNLLHKDELQNEAEVSQQKPEYKENHNPINHSENIQVNQANIKAQYQEDKDMNYVLSRPDHSNSKTDSEVINSYLHPNNISEETLELKVNQLLKKINASLDDVSSVEINSTTFDYYDYYTDDETLSQLERFKEKIISVNDKPGKQNESESTSKEQVRKDKSSEESASYDVENTTNYKHLSGMIEEKGYYSSSTTEEYEGTTFYSPESAFPNKETFSTANPPSSVISRSMSADGGNVEAEKILDEKMTKVPSVTAVPEVTTPLFPELAADSSVEEETDEAIVKKKDNNVISHSGVNTDNILQKHKPGLETDTTTDTLTTLTSNTETSTKLSTLPTLLNPSRLRPIYRTWKSTTAPPPISIRPSNTLLLPPLTTPTSSPNPVSIRPGGYLRVPPKTTPTTTLPPVSIRSISSLRLPPESISTSAPPQVSIRPSRLPKPSLKHGSNKESSSKKEDSEGKGISDSQKHSNEQNEGSNEFPLLPSFQEDLTQSTNVQPDRMKEPSSPETLQHPPTSPSNFTEDKSPNSSSSENYKTDNYDAMTPSSVLPTFSRKTFTLDKIHPAETKVNLTSTIPSEPVLQTKSKPLSSDVIKENVPQTLHGEKFTCMGKALNVYIPDPSDCYHFHYCSLGFHSRQLLDFHFLCDQGTAFSPLTNRCENEDEMLCGVLS